MQIVQAENLVKSYQVGEQQVTAIEQANFTINQGAFVSFVGPSGSGKSTLLNMLGCLDQPSSGRLLINQTDTSTLNRSQAAQFRGEHIGFIFQDFNLIPVLTVEENIEYPLLMVQNRPLAERRARVNSLMEAVGISEQAKKFPNQLSGGQKQRVAIARALASQAKLVLADEPTANLDHATAFRIIDLMKQMRDDYATTFIFSTHDSKIMNAAESLFILEDGKVSEQKNGDAK
ncbi:ABC transporter ATP-binding protein [Thiomicrorhabdus sp. 6S2-11]|jgi:putative ABC transport system ATP-binding protein|uniref:ABC transporter ATP-binding protein n=1 Tax=Thiomicrorhabdus marina TaxID=2818442 RepID=A0ABS3Q2A6_9GAMM|nr:ABC transporter ATP-binding protein [Thiomicrorhabdus marina]MBO1926416.1 ABC transporter ATP-binding protein [Thiomicrorhabdus marina]